MEDKENTSGHQRTSSLVDVLDGRSGTGKHSEPRRDCCGNSHDHRCPPRPPLFLFPPLSGSHGCWSFSPAFPSLSRTDRLPTVGHVCGHADGHGGSHPPHRKGAGAEEEELASARRATSHPNGCHAKAAHNGSPLSEKDGYEWPTCHSWAVESGSRANNLPEEPDQSFRRSPPSPSAATAEGEPLHSTYSSNCSEDSRRESGYHTSLLLLPEGSATACGMMPSDGDGFCGTSLSGSSSSNHNNNNSSNSTGGGRFGWRRGTTTFFIIDTEGRDTNAASRNTTESTRGVLGSNSRLSAIFPSPPSNPPAASLVRLFTAQGRIYSTDHGSINSVSGGVAAEMSDTKHSCDREGCRKSKRGRRFPPRIS